MERGHTLCMVCMRVHACACVCMRVCVYVCVYVCFLVSDSDQIVYVCFSSHYYAHPAPLPSPPIKCDCVCSVFMVNPSPPPPPLIWMPMGHETRQGGDRLAHIVRRILLGV